MLPLDEIRSRLNRVCIARAAKATSLHYNTVYRIAKGVTRDPKQHVMAELSDWLQGDLTS